MWESKARRRPRPVNVPAGAAIAEEPETSQAGARRRGRRLWWWLGGVWIVVLGLVVAAAGQWHYNWVSSLPHQILQRPPLVITPQPVAAPVALTTPSGEADVAAISRVLAPLVNRSTEGGMGPHVDVLVTGLTGSAVYTNGTDPVTPASTMKLLTTTAAMDVLGAQARFTTSVRMSGASTITLVGGGDPLLTTRPSSAGTYPVRASLTDLAAQTAAYLKAHHQTAVGLDYDASMFTGPSVNPNWPAVDLTTGVIAPISALWTNEGLLPNGTLSSNPPLSATQAFGSLLEGDGITVTGTPSSVVTTAADATIAHVTSAPLGEIIYEMLGQSDDAVAEVLGRHVAIATGQPASFVGATTAVTQTLAGLNIPLAGLTMRDTSGLSHDNRVEPATLAAILRLDASNPRLQPIIADLPISGYEGTLAPRFGETSATALGVVRAKTGTLVGVDALAGIAVDASGVPLIFVAIADQVPSAQIGSARADLDKIAAALTTCPCSQP